MPTVKNFTQLYSLKLLVRLDVQNGHAHLLRGNGNRQKGIGFAGNNLIKKFSKRGMRVYLEITDVHTYSYGEGEIGHY